MIAFTAVALGLIVGWFAFDTTRPWLWLGVGLLTGGALGNLADRIRDGAVTDFLDPPLWPAFNVADVAITVGVIVIALSALAPARPEPDAQTVSSPPRLVHVDERLAVVDKPAGLVVHPAPGHRGETLVSVLGELLGGGEEGRPGIVHRLDKDTSGLMVVARDDEAHRRLAAQIKRARRRRGPTWR